MSGRAGELAAGGTAVVDAGGRTGAPPHATGATRPASATIAAPNPTARRLTRAILPAIAEPPPLVVEHDLTVSYDSVRVSGMQWTLDELAQRVATALAADGVRAPNGRVTEVPDRRVIRWYTTIGLVDRPVGNRGRTALYGPRHLLQLVAVKRRQAQGRTLAEIQVELAGATDAMLRRVAAVPAELLDGATPTAPADEVPDQAPADQAPAALLRHPGRFWAQAVAAAPTEAVAPVPSGADLDGASMLAALRLGGGALLLLPGTPDPSDLAAIRSAAAGLLDLLAARGLLDPTIGRSRR